MSNEIRMIEILKELKNNHYSTGLKLSFEDENAKLVDSLQFKHIADMAELPVSLKIGGCEARKDLHDGRVLGVKNL